MPPPKTENDLFFISDIFQKLIGYQKQNQLEYLAYLRKLLII